MGVSANDFQQTWFIMVVLWLEGVYPSFFPSRLRIFQSLSHFSSSFSFSFPFVSFIKERKDKSRMKKKKERGGGRGVVVVKLIESRVGSGPRRREDTAGSIKPGGKGVKGGDHQDKFRRVDNPFWDGVYRIGFLEERKKRGRKGIKGGEERDYEEE